MDFIQEQLKDEFSLKEFQVKNTIELIDGGNTIPFIARYRKEMTGEMSDEVLRDFYERLLYLRKREERKEEIIRLIDEQGKLTDELRLNIEKAVTMAELEDLYRPYKQKKRTRATIAKEKGLEPLAIIIKNQELLSGDRFSVASEYINEEKLRELIEKECWNWNRISQYKYLSLDFIREWKDKLNWFNICNSQPIKDDFIDEFADYVDWGLVSGWITTDWLIDKYTDKIDWKIWSMSRVAYATERQIDKYANYFEWGCISSTEREFSEEFLLRHKNKIHWGTYFIANKRLNLDFIDKISDYFQDWRMLSLSQDLTEDFIRKYEDKVDWQEIFAHQKLSDKFIDEFKWKISDYGLNVISRRTYSPYENWEIKEHNVSLSHMYIFSLLVNI